MSSRVPSQSALSEEAEEAPRASGEVCGAEVLKLDGDREYTDVQENIVR